MPTNHTHPKRSFSGYLCRLLLVIASLWISLEVGAWLAFKPLAGIPFSYEALRTARHARLELLETRLNSKKSSSGMLFDLHPYLGYSGHPGTIPWINGSIPYNRYGMISISGHSYPYKAKPEDFVIGILGGSVAESFANLGEAYLGAELKAIDPRFKDKRIVVLSLATAGYKQPQQLFLLEYFLLLGFHFDLVLNVDGFNDLVLAVSNRTHGINPIYPSSTHYAVIASQTPERMTPEQVQLLAEMYTTLSHEGRVLRWVSNPPWCYSIFLNLLGERSSASNQERILSVQNQLVTLAQTQLPSELRGPPIHTTVNSEEEAAAAWSEASLMIHAVCSARGIPYVHVLQPNQYLDGSKPLTPHEKAVAINPNNQWGRIAQKGYVQLILAGQRLKQNGEAFYDLTQIFSNHPEDLYLDDCCHFNMQGDMIMARAIAQAISTTLSDNNKPSFSLK